MGPGGWRTSCGNAHVVCCFGFTYPLSCGRRDRNTLRAKRHGRSTIPVAIAESRDGYDRTVTFTKNRSITNRVRNISFIAFTTPSNHDDILPGRPSLFKRLPGAGLAERDTNCGLSGIGECKKTLFGTLRVKYFFCSLRMFRGACRCVRAMERQSRASVHTDGRSIGKAVLPRTCRAVTFTIWPCARSMYCRISKG